MLQVLSRLIYIKKFESVLNVRPSNLRAIYHLPYISHYQGKTTIFFARWTYTKHGPRSMEHLVDPVHGPPLINFRKHILPVNIRKDGLRTVYKIQIKYGIQYVIHPLLSM